jgi:hypothetical protein
VSDEFAEVRSRVEHVVGGIMRPSMEATPLPGEVALVDVVMVVIDPLLTALGRKDRLLRRLEEQRDRAAARATAAEEERNRLRRELDAHAQNESADAAAGSYAARAEAAERERDRAATRLREIRVVAADWHRTASAQPDGINWSTAAQVLATILRLIDTGEV